jgi:short-subunit dehydrogenase
MEALRTELQGTNIGVSVFCPGSVVSNIGQCSRNRPEALGNAASPGSEQKALMDAYGRRLRTALFKNESSNAFMDPEEAGQRVLDGVRNNDLYILSHAEYESAIRARSDALVESIPRAQAVPEIRATIAQIASTPIYTDEITRKRAPRQ